MRLHLFYHVWMVHHWRDIVREHVRILNDSGLSAHAGIHIGAIGAGRDLPGLIEIVRSVSQEIHYFGDNAEQYEFPTLDMLRAHCEKQDGLVCYFHTKGVSHLEDPNDTYRDWLATMNEHVLKNWLRCVNALDHGCDVAGCRFKLGEKELPYFAGNFWWAKNSYIRDLPPIEHHSRFEAEIWAFKNDPKSFDIPVKPL